MACIFTASARNKLKSLEALRLTAYLDDPGVWTIGYGHTGHEVVPGLVWTKEIAEHQFNEDVAHFEIGIKSLIPDENALNPNQYSALVIFAYNIGIEMFAASSVLGKIKQKKLRLVPERMMLYVWVHDRKTHVAHKSEGLIIRRKAEVEIWNEPWAKTTSKRSIEARNV